MLLPASEASKGRGRRERKTCPADDGGYDAFAAGNVTGDKPRAVGRFFGRRPVSGWPPSAYRQQSPPKHPGATRAGDRSYLNPNLDS